MFIKYIYRGFALPPTLIDFSLKKIFPNDSKQVLFFLRNLKKADFDELLIDFLQIFTKLSSILQFKPQKKLKRILKINRKLEARNLNLSTKKLQSKAFCKKRKKKLKNEENFQSVFHTRPKVTSHDYVHLVNSCCGLHRL